MAAADEGASIGRDSEVEHAGIGQERRTQWQSRAPIPELDRFIQSTRGHAFRPRQERAGEYLRFVAECRSVQGALPPVPDVRYFAAPTGQEKIALGAEASHE